LRALSSCYGIVYEMASSPPNPCGCRKHPPVRHLQADKSPLISSSRVYQTKGPSVNPPRQKNLSAAVKRRRVHAVALLAEASRVQRLRHCSPIPGRRQPPLLAEARVAVPQVRRCQSESLRGSTLAACHVANRAGSRSLRLCRREARADVHALVGSQGPTSSSFLRAPLELVPEIRRDARLSAGRSTSAGWSSPRFLDRCLGYGDGPGFLQKEGVV
jgi:hypothetical protein